LREGPVSADVALDVRIEPHGEAVHPRIEARLEVIDPAVTDGTSCDLIARIVVTEGSC
jgi:hypothetical protein